MLGSGRAGSNQPGDYPGPVGKNRRISRGFRVLFRYHLLKKALTAAANELAADPLRQASSFRLLVRRRLVYEYRRI